MLHCKSGDDPRCPWLAVDATNHPPSASASSAGASTVTATFTVGMPLHAFISKCLQIHSEGSIQEIEFSLGLYPALSEAQIEAEFARRQLLMHGSEHICYDMRDPSPPGVEHRERERRVHPKLFSARPRDAVMNKL